ncbi:hypothetical protein LINGRAHAP2_LOCUS33735 [Linum grandiflorum]
MTTKLVILMIVLLASHNIEAAMRILRCGDIANPITFSSTDLKYVLAALKKETTWGFSPSRYYPYNTAGSAKGWAKCYTRSKKGCRKCLGLAEGALADHCVKRRTGTYRTPYCSMEFWQI